jgi:hypothetical protein
MSRPRAAILRFVALFVSFFATSCGAAEAAGKVDWWSFKPAARISMPAVRSGWPRNDLDRFTFAKLERENLSPSPEADRRTLVRRVTFDLIGLPPTPGEVRAFLADPSTNAYEKVVERLLASARYGEHWARHWLDTVHYGETHGYDKDKPRPNAWPYRDYVIEAFNSDKPYSRFVEEQLAADVLFPDEPQLIPALGFIAAGPWDFVGHVELPITKTDGLIARYNDRDDMVMNTMSTFQSLTVHCARCHDHKFDPITQRDYYGLQAVFSGVDRADRPFDSDAGIAKQRREFASRLAELKAARTNLDLEMTKLGGGALAGLDAKIGEAKKSMRFNSAAFGYHSQISAAQNAEKWVEVDLGESRALDKIVFVACHDDFNNIGAGFGFPLRYKIEASDDAQFRDGVTIVADQMAEDVPNPKCEPQSVAICSCLTPDGSQLKARYVRFTATKLAPRRNDYIFALAELMIFNAAGENLAQGVKVSALDSIDAPPRWQRQNLVDGSYFGVETNASGTIAQLETERAQLLRRVVPEALNRRIAQNEGELVATQQQLASLPKPSLVYAAANEFVASGSFIPAKHPRPVHLLKRGDVKKPGEEVKPAGVAAVPGVSAAFSISDSDSEGERRAALAKWITDTNNLLTRRSIVNRVWAHHFGKGIVETPNDFGHMGARPSHPALLDWLAFWFLDHGESFKELHRLIVTSATYRQSSEGTDSTPSHSRQKVRDAVERVPTTSDSANHFLWRMNRTRLDAEQFHDALLAISGDLDLAMGGPSVRQFWFKDDHSPVYDYARYAFAGPGANRRSIYRFIVRSVPDPFMDALDCPDANILTPVRNTTQTALQALATLNDAFVIRECEHFAARLQRERTSFEDQISRAYELALNRGATAVERAKLIAHARKHGLASACRVILNSNEFMFVD